MSSGCTSGMFDSRLIAYVPLPDGSIRPLYWSAWDPDGTIPVCRQTNRFHGRLVDYVIEQTSGGWIAHPVYAAHDRCCQTRKPVEREYLQTNCQQEPVPTELLVRIYDTDSCPALHCQTPEGECHPVFVVGGLTGQAHGGGADPPYWLWTGSIAGQSMQLRCSGGIWDVSFPPESCFRLTQTPGVICPKPFWFRIPDLEALYACCGCQVQALGSGTLARVSMDVVEQCPPRYPARLVDYVPSAVGQQVVAKPVYLATEHCRLHCPPSTCCGDHACDLVAHFLATGTCTCLDGQSVLLPLVHAGVWDSGTFASCSPPVPWHARLECASQEDPHCPKFNFSIECQTNCSIHLNDIGPYCCWPEFDIEFEFTLLCVDNGCGREYAPPCCCPPESVPSYIVRITRA